MNDLEIEVKGNLTEVVVVMDHKVRSQIQFYVDNCDTEIGGLGRVVWQRDKKYLLAHVVEVYCLKQEVSAVTTSLDEVAIAELLYDERRKKGHISYWWHSHVDMDVIWSGTDRDTMFDFIKEGGRMVYGVFNKSHQETHAYLQQPTPEEEHLCVFANNVTLQVEDNSFGASEKKKMLKEIKEKLTERGFIAPAMPLGPSIPGVGTGTGLHTDYRPAGSKYYDNLYRETQDRLDAEDRKWEKENQEWEKEAWVREQARSGKANYWGEPTV